MEFQILRPFTTKDILHKAFYSILIKSSSILWVGNQIDFSFLMDNHMSETPLKFATLHHHYSQDHRKTT